MHTFFLIPLMVSLVSSYVSFNSKEDISYLFGIIAGGCLILSLVLAPWQLQLLILLLGGVYLKQFWLKEVNTVANFEPLVKTSVISNPEIINGEISLVKNSNESALEPELSDNFETGKYRGVTLTKDEKLVSFATRENDEILGKYRGQLIKGHSVTQDLKIKKKTEIKYRGAIISTDQETSF